MLRIFQQQECELEKELSKDRERINAEIKQLNDFPSSTNDLLKKCQELLTEMEDIKKEKEEIKVRICLSLFWVAQPTAP